MDDKAQEGLIRQEEYTMSIENIIAQVSLIQEVMNKVMQKDQHYGTIPGTDKPSLYKPGAEKLCLTFRLSPSYEVEVENLGREHRSYRIKCTLSHIPTGNIFGEGVGECSTLESKYRYRKAEQKCPTCGQEAIIKGKKEYGGGWVCFKKKGGCGAKFDDKDPTIENQEMGRIEHDNPADYYNTCLKMGKKRAHVDAVLTATAASDIFTQDIEDMGQNESNGEKEKKQEKPKAEPKTDIQKWWIRVKKLLKESEITEADFTLWVKNNHDVESSKDLPPEILDEIEITLKQEPGKIVDAIGKLKELLAEPVQEELPTE